MNVIRRLWNALASLAGSVEALSLTLGEANASLRERLALTHQQEEAPALPAPTPPPAPTVPVPEPAPNGRPGRRTKEVAS